MRGNQESIQLSGAYVQEQTSWGTEGKGGAVIGLSNPGKGGGNGGRDGRDTPSTGATGVVHHRRARGSGMRDDEGADTESEMARSRMRNIGRCEVVPVRGIE